MLGGENLRDLGQCPRFPRGSKCSGDHALLTLHRHRVLRGWRPRRLCSLAALLLRAVGLPVPPAMWFHPAPEWAVIAHPQTCSLTLRSS